MASVPFTLSLKAIRVNAELTQDEFASLIGVTKSTIHNWEMGNTEPSLSEVRRISDITKIPVDFFRPTKSN